MSAWVDMSQYMPHGMCLLWKPWLVFLWAGSDLLIFLSYSAIPLALLTVLKKRGDLPFGKLVVLFASFILLCGLTHLMGIVTLWYAIYPYVGLLKLATGIVSAITAVTLFRLIPTLVALPSPDMLRDANERLKDEIESHQDTLEGLEATVSERTAELNELNRKLAVQAREAVHRSRNLLSVVSSIASQTAQSAQGTQAFLDAFQHRIASLADATSMVVEAGQGGQVDLRAVAERQLQPVLGAFPDRVTLNGPSIMITAEAAQQLALALHELATNAQKYRLSDDQDATVEIDWHHDAEAASFEFVWSESGSKAAKDLDEPDRVGFGTKLLDRVVPAMLRGKAERELGPTGMSYRLETPSVAVLATDADKDGHAMAARLVDQNFGLD